MNKAESRDEIARKRVTYLMKTPMKTLVKSRKYKQWIKECIKEHGHGWWYFSDTTVNRRRPWLWRFKDGKEE